MPRYADPVEVSHPDSPGETHVVPRSQFASLGRRGWVEAAPSAAEVPADTEPQTAVDVDTEPPAKGAAKEKK